MKLSRKQKREVAKRISNRISGSGNEPASTHCLARPEARVSHWQILLDGQLLRVMYDSATKTVATEANVLQSPAASTAHAA